MPGAARASARPGCPAPPGRDSRHIVPEKPTERPAEKSAERKEPIESDQKPASSQGSSAFGQT
jgi:hypothetical protein